MLILNIVIAILLILYLYSLYIIKGLNNRCDKLSILIEQQIKELVKMHDELASIPHHYRKNLTSGIGFCDICFSDDMNDGNHIL
jgi:cell division protein FtsB